MSVVMYGMPPDWPPPILPVPPEPIFPIPIQPTPNVGRFTIEPTVTPAPPPEVGALYVQMLDRIAWLERELKMHEAWRLELETLKRMAAALPPPSTSGEPK